MGNLDLTVAMTFTKTTTAAMSKGASALIAFTYDIVIAKVSQLVLQHVYLDLESLL